MPDESDAPVEQATAAPGEKRTVVVDRSTVSGVIVCPHCGGAIPDPEADK